MNEDELKEFEAFKAMKVKQEEEAKKKAEDERTKKMIEEVMAKVTPFMRDNNIPPPLPKPIEPPALDNEQKKKYRTEIIKTIQKSVYISVGASIWGFAVFAGSRFSMYVGGALFVLGSIAMAVIGYFDNKRLNEWKSINK